MTEMKIKMKTPDLLSPRRHRRQLGAGVVLTQRRREAERCGVGFNAKRAKNAKNASMWFVKH